MSETETNTRKVFQHIKLLWYPNVNPLVIRGMRVHIPANVWDDVSSFIRVYLSNDTIIEC